MASRFALASVHIFAGIWVAQSAIPPCATKGVAYEDPEITKPNGGKPYDALACQMFCETNPDCEVFTYYTETKACWLLSGNAKVAANGKGAVSGPEDCAHMLPGTAGKNEPNPLKDFPGVVVESAESAEPVIAARETANGNVQITDASTGASAGASTGSGFPWAWLLGGAAVGGVLLGVYYLSKGEKRARGKTPRGAKVEADAESGQADDVPLMGQGAAPALPAGPSPQPWLAAPPVPQYYQQPPMQAPLYNANYPRYPNQVYY